MTLLALVAAFDVAALSAGYIREVGTLRGATIGVGVLGTASVVPSALKSYYGSSFPLGAMVFVRLRAARARADDMAGMHGMKHP